MKKRLHCRKKAPGQSQQETEAAFTKMKEVHLDALYKGTALHKTSLSAMPKTKELNHTAQSKPDNFQSLESTYCEMLTFKHQT